MPMSFFISISPYQFFQRFLVGSAGDAVLGDDGGHVACRRHVERGVLYGGALGRDRVSEDVRHFLRGALLDRDLVTGRKRKVKRGDRAATKKGTPFSLANTATEYVPTLLATSPLAAIRSAPTTTQPIRPDFMKWPAMLSVMSVVGMLSC